MKQRLRTSLSPVLYFYYSKPKMPVNTNENNSQKSFTLIELLVVIAIIGLLASIVIVNVNSARDKAKVAAVLQFSQSLYHALGAEAVGVWSFETIETGNKVIDSSGYRNDGILNGANLVLGLEQLGNALNFNGVSEYVNIAHNSSLDLTADLTIEAWINPKLGGGSDGIISKGTGDNDDDYTYYLSVRNTGQIDFSGGNAAGNGRAWDLTTTPDDALTANTWQHVVASVGGNKAKVYVNGKLIITVGVSGTRQSNTNNAMIGRGLTTGQYWDGQLDEVRIYAQALTIGQIQKHYAEGLEKHQDLTLK